MDIEEQINNKRWMKSSPSVSEQYQRAMKSIDSSDYREEYHPSYKYALQLKLNGDSFYPKYFVDEPIDEIEELLRDGYTESVDRAYVDDRGVQWRFFSKFAWGKSKKSNDGVQRGLDILHEGVLPQLKWMLDGGDGDSFDRESLRGFYDNITDAVSLIESGISDTAKSKTEKSESDYDELGKMIASKLGVTDAHVVTRENGSEQENVLQVRMDDIKDKDALESYKYEIDGDNAHISLDEVTKECGSMGASSAGAVNARYSDKPKKSKTEKFHVSNGGLRDGADYTIRINGKKINVPDDDYRPITDEVLRLIKGRDAELLRFCHEHWETLGMYMNDVDEMFEENKEYYTYRIADFVAFDIWNHIVFGHACSVPTFGIEVTMELGYFN